MKYFFNSLLLVLLFVSCKTIKESKQLAINPKGNLNTPDSRFWHFKDFQKDSVLGISLDKWYDQNDKKTKSKNIIVAVIDSQIDLNQEDLQGQIWINNKEIIGNNIDDDHNGYVDDINGWSFLGTKNGGYVVWGNYECVRFIREWQPIFKSKTEAEIPPSDLKNYKEYQRAINQLEKKEKYFTNYRKSIQYSVNVYQLAKDTLRYYFPKENYTYNQLDSMYTIYNKSDKSYGQRRDDNDKDFGSLIDEMKTNIELNSNSIDILKESLRQLDSVIAKNLNIQYDERKLIGDNPKVLEKGYGNQYVSATIAGITSTKDHCTKVSGIIAANRKNDKGSKGFAQEIQIMPLNVSLSGDESDKDIAMAIRYAVDNGAKVINMSIGKEFSLHKEWVFEAYQYAEKHNVLIVHASGNDGFDVDVNPYFPSDHDYNGSDEVSANFINVGSISNKVGDKLVSVFSNYGKQNVDIFAPGEGIYTATEGNKYEFDSGTSLAAPMVSGTAALIWLYYPKLTAKEVKQIILDSGTTYQQEVVVPGTRDKKVNFSELSKSGKVLNVYNAMKMAEEVSKKKS